MERRRFISTLGAGAGAFALAPRLGGFAEPKKLDRVGLELYAVRKAMRADPERALAAIRAVGYDDVELLWSFGNFGRTPPQVRATLDKEGLKAPSAHIAPEIIVDPSWNGKLDDARLLGHRFLIVPSLPNEAKLSLDDWKSWADKFNAAGAVAKNAGVSLAFHNEPGHMRAIGGVVPYDAFVERLDPNVVLLQLDVGNMLMGGGDPTWYLERYRDRYVSFHLKDVVADRSRDTELGTGAFDFKHFLSAVPNVGDKPCYVEQETPTDEMESARKNVAFLRALRF
ncbi:MAG TPA: sugar phosphate isomerase/epimerase family protein [Gemmatimonadaceae bacterium]|nr:sugar phosphate isomerase/epimerase family protein [Gemmatimonadaceae bacterium]